MDARYHAQHPASEDWRLPDLTAAYLCVDRDVCRRAFFDETVEAVSEAVRYVLAGKGAPDYDPERALTEWARGRGAGVFGEKRHRTHGQLRHVGAVAEGVLLGLVERRPRLNPASEHHLYLAGVRAEERRLERDMTPSELERFERRFHAAGYRRNLDAIPPEAWDEAEPQRPQGSGPQGHPPAR